MTEPTETELKLVVWERDPQALARRLWSRRRLDSYRLRVEGRVELTDTYFDTPGRDLSERGVALRTREEDGRRLVTLKGSAEVREGVPRRLEVEAEWSERAAATLGRELRRIGLDVGGPRPWRRDPRAAIEAMGFVLLSRRRTVRLPRSVSHAEEAGGPVAELAIDRVSDRVGRRAVRHYEVEVEAVDASATSDVVRIGRELERLVGEGLRAFGHSKLAVSLAIQDLASRDDGLEGLVDDHGYLTPEGWGAISRRLRRDEVVGRLPGDD